MTIRCTPVAFVHTGSTTRRGCTRRSRLEIRAAQAVVYGPGLLRGVWGPRRLLSLLSVDPRKGSPIDFFVQRANRKRKKKTEAPKKGSASSPPPSSTAQTTNAGLCTPPARVHLPCKSLSSTSAGSTGELICFMGMRKKSNIFFVVFVLTFCLLNSAPGSGSAGSAVIGIFHADVCFQGCEISMKKARFWDGPREQSRPRWFPQGRGLAGGGGF